MRWRTAGGSRPESRFITRSCRQSGPRTAPRYSRPSTSRAPASHHPPRAAQIPSNRAGMGLHSLARCRVDRAPTYRTQRKHSLLFLGPLTGQSPQCHRRGSLQHPHRISNVADVGLDPYQHLPVDGIVLAQPGEVVVRDSPLDSSPRPLLATESQRERRSCMIPTGRWQRAWRVR